MLKKATGLCSVSPGCYSTARIVSADVLLKIPSELDFEMAAGMLLKGMTVSYLFKRVANLQPFHKVLFMLPGGTGLIAMQWARMMDVEITGTVSSEEKKELAKNYGAVMSLTMPERILSSKLEISHRVAESM